MQALPDGLSVRLPGPDGKEHTFTYDKVFKPEASQVGEMEPAFSRRRAGSTGAARSDLQASTSSAHSRPRLTGLVLRRPALASTFLTLQAAVFEEVSDLVQSALDGYKVCLFSYGQTGAGKTHTMQGSRSFEGQGIIPRAIAKVGTASVLMIGGARVQGSAPQHRRHACAWSAYRPPLLPSGKPLGPTPLPPAWLPHPSTQPTYSTSPL